MEMPREAELWDHWLWMEQSMGCQGGGPAFGSKKLCLLTVGVLQFLLVLPTWVVITVRFPLTRVWSRGIVDVVQRQNTASLTGTGGRYRVQTKVGWLSSSGFGHRAGFLFSFSLFKRTPNRPLMDLWWSFTTPGHRWPLLILQTIAHTRKYVAKCQGQHLKGTRILNMQLVFAFGSPFGPHTWESLRCPDTREWDSQ